MRISTMVMIFMLCGCGVIGIGSNHDVTIHNQSNDVIFAIGDMGRMKIQPNALMEMHTAKDILLVSRNDICDELTVRRRLNRAAVFLDVFPGLFLGIIPLLVDSMAGDLYKMPREFTYNCR